MTAREPVVVVGVPVGGAGEIGAPGRDALAEATLLCGGARHLDRLPEHGEERMVIGDVGACVERLRRRRPGERAVVVATGDPLLFGIGATLVRELGAAALRVLPATSSVQEAFARAGVPWDGARLVSAHGRPLDEAVAAAAGSTVAAVLCGPDAPPEAVARGLAAAGVHRARCVVAEQLGEAAERVTDASIEAVARGSFDPLSVLLLLREPAGPPAVGPAGRRFGREHDAFAHCRGMVTRAEVRAVVLARLHRLDDTVVWDVGAGSGSIGIEAAGLAPQARVYAVERDPAQLTHLRANAAALGAGRVDVVAGEAPGALLRLPHPDAVAVGGHGGRLGDILAAVRDRLRPGGRIVCSLATLEGVEAARAALAGWDPEVVQVSIARGVPAGRSLRLRAEDPVIVVSAVRPAGGGPGS